MSREDKVISYLTRHKTITSLQIIKMFGATSPSKITSNVREKLRLMGMTLADRWIKNDKTGSRYKVYWITEVAK